LSSPKTTLKVPVGGVIGAGCYYIFSIIGVFAQAKGMQGAGSRLRVGKRFLRRIYSFWLLILFHD